MIALNDGANIAKTDNEEGYALQEEVDVVAPLAIHEVIASTEEEERSKSQLQVVHSVNKVLYHVSLQMTSLVQILFCPIG